MATLILDRQDLELRADGNALALYEPNGRRGSVPLKLLDRVILQGNIRLDTGVLTLLAERGASTLMLSKRQSRRVAIVLGVAHNDAGIRIAQSKRLFDDEWKHSWALQLVTRKVRNQRLIIAKAMEARPDQRKALFDARQALDNTLLSLGCHPVPEIKKLRGYEGAAARSYFSGFTQLFAPSLNFTGRNRRPPKDPVNACLSLGYTLLHFDAVRAAHIAGLDPLIGFYHSPAFGRESLASDLIEPLRPHLDHWVWQLFRERRLREDHFSLNESGCLLGKTGREIFYAGYEAGSPAWRRSLRRYCQNLANSLRTEGQMFLEDPSDEDHP